MNGHRHFILEIQWAMVVGRLNDSLVGCSCPICYIFKVLNKMPTILLESRSDCWISAGCIQSKSVAFRCTQCVCGGGHISLMIIILIDNYKCGWGLQPATCCGAEMRTHAKWPELHVNGHTLSNILRGYVNRIAKIYFIRNIRFFRMCGCFVHAITMRDRQKVCRKIIAKAVN